MPSPFPGMDPYLEGPTHWSDFHPTFIQTWREAIAEQLPPNYHARVEEMVLRVEPEIPEGLFNRPDVLVAREPKTGQAIGGMKSDIAVAEPAHTRIPNIIQLDPYVETFIEIHRHPDYELVTVLELLSPTNKSGDGRGQYVSKREALLHQPVHIVELDLLRGGQRIRLAKPLPKDHYFALISRADRRPDCDVYHWNVRNRLPVLPVPLRAPDADIHVDLQAAFSEAFRRGRYDRMIKYDGPPSAPQFDPEDAEWVVQTRAAVK